MGDLAGTATQDLGHKLHSSEEQLKTPEELKAKAAAELSRTQDTLASTGDLKLGAELGRTQDTLAPESHPAECVDFGRGHLRCEYILHRSQMK